MIVTGLAIMLLGLIVPMATTFLLENILPSGQAIMVGSIAVLLAGTAVSKFLFSVVKEMMRGRVEQKMKVELQSAVFARILNLPVQFFKEYSAGELSERVMALTELCTIFGEILLGFGMTALFSSVYLIQILSIAPVMFLPALAVLFVQLLIAGVSVYGRLTVMTMELEASTKVQGIVYEIFSGIQKIKLAGCEERAFAKWAEKYQMEAKARYNPPFAFKVQNALSPVVTILGSMLLFAVAANKSLSVPQYAAFNTSFGMVSGAILELTSVAAMISALRPIMDLAEPILKAKPEVCEERQIVKKVKGSIELNNISFRYTDDGPWIIDHLNLKIPRGQYLAIVGTTGCGKTTLMRLMMGFETPKSGAVYYDGKDIQKLDQKSLRQQIGVVMQNGKLFSGDIFSNITISAPQLGLKEAWEAAEMAGVADDIRNMPMGMQEVSFLNWLKGKKTKVFIPVQSCRKNSIVRRYPSKRMQQAKVCPYLLRNAVIDRPNQVWSINITYIPIKRGFLYLTQYNNIREARKAIGKYVHIYNFERCHSALNNQTPASCYYPILLLDNHAA